MDIVYRGEIVNIKITQQYIDHLQPVILLKIIDGDKVDMVEWYDYGWDKLSQ